MKIYAASSWRNTVQPGVVRMLKTWGHWVYDFRHPHATRGDRGRRGVGFSWSEIDPNWKDWTSAEFAQGLEHPAARDGFGSDFDAMKWADACVLVMPCGRSAHLEAGWFVGAGKRLAILLEDGEPELMYLMADALCADLDELRTALNGFSTPAGDREGR